MPTAYENIPIAGGDTSQPIAMAKRLDLIERHLRPSAKRFLDCGCGAGEYVLALVDRFGLDAYGIEFEMDKIQQAHSKRALRNRVTRGDLQAIHFASCTWDYALLNEVLEHVPDDRKALREVYRILRPGGLLFIFSQNRWFPFEAHVVRLRQSGRWVPDSVSLSQYI